MTKPTMNLPGTDKKKAHTFTLEEPIVRDNGNTITELTIRKPKAGELRGLNVSDLVKGDVDTMIVVLPRIALPAIGDHEAAALETEDLGEVAGAMLAFFTGQMSSRKKTEEA